MNALCKDLMKELECPVCMDYMVPPIMMCENGHNICDNCKPKLDKCPSCSKPFLSVRNIALENLAGRVDYPCCNKVHGCNLEFPPNLIEDHQKICLNKPYDCPLAEAETIMCDWVGGLHDLKKHIEAAHQDRLTKLITPVRGVFLKKYNSDFKYSRVIFACRQMFYQQFEVINNVFYFVIQHVGPENCPSKYQYNFTIQTDEHMELISMSFIARSCKVNIQNLYRWGQCVKLFFETLDNFMGPNNEFKFEFSIVKVS